MGTDIMGSQNTVQRMLELDPAAANSKADHC